MARDPQDDGLGARLGDALDGLGRLVAEHVKRSKLELLLAARTLARQAVLAVLVCSLLVVGHLLVCAGIAAALAPSLGPALALALVGGANVGLGAVGLVLVRDRFERGRLLEGAVDEVGQSVLAITAASTRKAGP